MLFIASTSPDVISTLGSTASEVITAYSDIILVFFGVIFAFFVLKVVVGIGQVDDKDEEE